jgi:monoamine oxidase
MVSKRDFLKGFAALAGSPAMLATLDAWGMGFKSISHVPPELRGNAEGKKIVILGAGLAGLTSAYELSQRGYQCHIIEARDFSGGRCQTARNGFQLDELGRAPQVCDFDDGLYFNHAAWRIPQHQKSILYYCRKFAVPLEILVNINDNTYVIHENIEGPLKGKRLRRREVMADMRGYSAELLAKVTNQEKLGETMGKEDREQLVEYLINEGFLDANDLSYKGTSNRGYTVEPGAGIEPGEGVLSQPLLFKELLNSGLGNIFRGVASYERPYTMFQPIGGMDKIAQAFTKHVGQMITYSAEIQQIHNEVNGVRISYKDLGSGNFLEEKADYCICTIPPGITSRIKNNFSQICNEALKAPVSAQVGKLSLQMNRRFWEEDDGIFGGRSETDNQDYGTVAYPSHGWLTDKGIVQGYYNGFSNAIKVSAMTHQQRVEFGMIMGEKFHPGQYRKHYDGKSLSVAWHLINYSLGGWEEWSAEARRKHYPELLKPQGRVLFAGTHLSHLTGWQAGAIESAWQQIAKLHTSAITV